MKRCYSLQLGSYQRMTPFGTVIHLSTLLVKPADSHATADITEPSIDMLEQQSSLRIAFGCAKSSGGDIAASETLHLTRTACCPPCGKSHSMTSPT
jgi:hypothetical protein